MRDEYGRRLKAQQEGLAAICAAAGFGFAIHRTDHSPEAALLGLYVALTRQMIFAAPWVLLALPALPLLWWLLRVTPPAPRSETFPAIRLLMGLHAREETPARTPWWLLLLRMTAATLVILALARPVLDAGSTLAGSRAGAAGGGQWLGVGRRLAAPDAGGEHGAGPCGACRAPGGTAAHRTGRIRRLAAHRRAAAGG